MESKGQRSRGNPRREKWSDSVLDATDRCSQLARLTYHSRTCGRSTLLLPPPCTEDVPAKPQILAATRIVPDTTFPELHGSRPTAQIVSRVGYPFHHGYAARASDSFQSVLLAHATLRTTDSDRPTNHLSRAGGRHARLFQRRLRLRARI